MRLYPVLILLIISYAACSTERVEVITIEGIIEPPDEMTVNPFFTESPLPFEAPDFNEFKDEHYLPAFEEGMSRQLLRIYSIASNPAEPTFENTVEAMEKSGELLRRVQRVFFNIASAHTNERIQEIQAELAPRLAAHSDKILLNARLFERIHTLYEDRDELDLDEESLKLLEETHRDFVRAGAQLSAGDQERIREINERISSLMTEFQEKLLKMTRERAVVVEDVEMLDGLGSDRIEAARQAARERGLEGAFLLKLANTTRQPVLKHLNDREMRRRVWEASAYRGTGRDGGIDTRPIVLELVSLRAEKAGLLGYGNWASYTLEPQTAQTPRRVLDMLIDLIRPVVDNTQREVDQIRAKMIELDGIVDEMMPWDWEYYAEKVRKEEFDFDEDQVRPYFELNRVLEDGVFYTLQRMYGITFEERDDLPVYHPEVRVFDVFEEDGEQLGLFYADLFERDSKRGGAWMNSLVVQSHLLEQRPVVVNVLNIPRPAAGGPALLSFDQVTTLFHEMGHAVHGLFSDVRYPSLAGTSVPRDFVEFPSAVKEDWAIHPEVLGNYAVHYETGEPVPSALIDRIIDARDFNQGFDTQEHLAATLIDMEWHRLRADEIPDDVEEFEQAVLSVYELDFRPVPPRYKSPYFSHIFAGDYSANYYSYIWSEVMAADAFVYMQERNGLTREMGDHFRDTILSRGGSRNAMDLYLEFRGREPDVEHLLRRRGLAVDE